MIDNLDRDIINQLQDGFPVVDEPFAQVADQLGISAKLLIERIESLLATGVLSRFGPMFNPQRMGSAVTLAAINVPQERFENVSALVNTHKQVAHNYARTHDLNMWFVATGETPQHIEKLLQEIEDETGLKVLNFPKEEEFFIGLKLEV